MPWAFLLMMGVYGILSIVFAFVEPPPRIGALFRVPAIFIFLPNRLIVPAGRLFVGACSLAVAAFVVFNVLMVKN